MSIEKLSARDFSYERKSAFIVNNVAIVNSSVSKVQPTIGSISSARRMSIYAFRIFLQCDREKLFKPKEDMFFYSNFTNNLSFEF